MNGYNFIYIDNMLTITQSIYESLRLFNSSYNKSVTSQFDSKKECNQLNIYNPDKISKVILNISKSNDQEKIFNEISKNSEIKDIEVVKYFLNRFYDIIRDRKGTINYVNFAPFEKEYIIGLLNLCKENKEVNPNILTNKNIEKYLDYLQ